jgi:hypothetical protein
MGKASMAENDYERFAKWQGVTREQLGANSNVVLVLATGLLGFVTVAVLERKLAAYSFDFGISAAVLLAVSVGLALWCAMNRLADFRLTAQIAHPKNSGTEALEAMRDTSKCLGERTWLIFRGQIWSFGLGVAAAGVAVIIQVAS